MSKDDLRIVGSCTYTNINTQDQKTVEYIYTYDDLHDMPWQVGDEMVDEFMESIPDMQSRFEQRVEDMVWGLSNEESVMEEPFAGEDIEDWRCEQDDWVYHIEGGTWEDFVREDLKRFIEGENVNG